MIQRISIFKKFKDYFMNYTKIVRCSLDVSKFNLRNFSGTSSIMSRGFYNNIRVSLRQGWKQPLQPIIVVHDSNTNYIPVSKVFEMRPFYDKYYTEYCASFGPKILLLFDLQLEAKS